MHPAWLARKSKQSPPHAQHQSSSGWSLHGGSAPPQLYKSLAPPLVSGLAATLDVRPGGLKPFGSYSSHIDGDAVKRYLRELDLKLEQMGLVGAN